MMPRMEDTLGATTRALAANKDLAVKFGRNKPANTDNMFYLSGLPDWQDVPSLRLCRGELDHMALMQRYHDAAIHRKYRPKTHQAAQVFDALEDVRVELFGGHHMEGVKQNIHFWRQEHYVLRERSDGHQQDEILPMALSGALEETVTGYSHHPTIQPFIEHWQGKIKEHASAEYRHLQNALANQEAFAKRALKLLDALHLLDMPNQEKLQKDKIENTEFEESVDSEGMEEGQEFETETPSSTSQMQAEQSAEESSDQQQTQETLGELEGHMPLQPGHNYDAQPVPDHYRIFTRKFDEQIQAADLATPQELEALNRQLTQKLLPLQAAAARMANRLQRLLLAKQRREWLLDQEEGLLDAKRLPRLITAPTDPHYFKREKDAKFRDTVVTLLIDNSGSMRGRPITIAALSASILGKALERSGVKVELLGFTTRDWKGGEAGRQWAKAGKPVNPGRLNDLRHIIYKSADQPWRKAQHALGLMLKEGILKENIDGEAMLWAVDRLKKRPEDRKILMVISDGAPVDDSTLSNNQGNYLDKHLRQVIAQVEQDRSIELLAVGIGHDVTRYYRHAITITEVETLPQVMGEELLELFAN